MLRVDPDTGAGLPDNPLSGSTDPNARRIVATGLRNPFRLASRPGTSQIFVGDVGWTAWEEINRIDSATDGSVDNFGWPCYEGNGRQGGYDGANLTICEDLYARPAAPAAARRTQPFFTYSHGGSVVSGDGCADGRLVEQSGLAFYQGGAYPASYDGALFFSDYSRKCVWVMFEQGGQPLPSTRQLFARNVDPVNLKIGPGGDLFIVDFNGSIRRMRYSSNNQPPTAVAQATPTTGPLPLTVTFDGRGSTDPDAGDSLSYAWDLDGDGLFDDSFSAQPSRTYTSQGAVTARLRVTDSSGESDTDSIEINPGGDPPQATIATPAPTLRWAVGDTITFSGSATDPQQGTLPDSALSWSLDPAALHDRRRLPQPPAADLGGRSPAAQPLVSTRRTIPTRHTWSSALTATDSSGLTDTETVRLDPRTVDLTFRTQPSGLKLTVGPPKRPLPSPAPSSWARRTRVSAPDLPTAGRGHVPIRLLVGWRRTSPRGRRPFLGEHLHGELSGGLAACRRGWWRRLGFNEGAGVSVGDASPEGNGGTVSGASWSAAGRFGGALSFDGVNDWVTVADDPSLDLSGALTVEAWVRPTALSGYRTVALKEHPPGALPMRSMARMGQAVGRGVDEQLLSWRRGRRWRPVLGRMWRSPIRRAVCVCMWMASGQHHARCRARCADTSGPLRIGGNAIWSGEFFAGLIDELRVYNRALSATEIQTDMNLAVAPDNSPPGAPPNLTASGGLGQVALDWDAASDNVGVTAITCTAARAPALRPGLATGSRW